MGILTERDFLERVIACRKDPCRVSGKEVMSSPVICVAPTYSVFSAARRMDEMNVRRLVVMKGGRPCGIVAQTDIFRAVKRKLREEEDENLMQMERVLSRRCEWHLISRDLSLPRLIISMLMAHLRN